MSDRYHAQAAPDYTNSFLVSSGVLTFMSFWVILGLWGFLAVVLIAVTIDRLIQRLLRRS